MNYFTVGAVLVSLAVLSSAKKEEWPPVSPTEPDRVMRFFIFPLNTTIPTGGLSVEGVQAYHARELMIKEPDLDLCARGWEELSKTPYYTEIPGKVGNIRVVLRWQNKTIGFDRSGKWGYVDGMPVAFREKVSEWFNDSVRGMSSF